MIDFVINEIKMRYYNDDWVEYQRPNKKWKKCGIYNHKKIYKNITFTINKKIYKYYLHRVIYYVFNQEWNINDISKDNKIDHIDHPVGQILNNSISNLRVATQQQNTFNRNCRGYYFDKKTNKYHAQIKINGKLIYLGYFEKEDDAKQAYLNAKLIYHIIE